MDHVKQVVIEDAPPTSGTSRLSEAEIHVAQQAIDAARERGRAARSGGLKPVVELVVVSRAQAAFAKLEQCSLCHNEVPPFGGPYCDCHFGQVWRTKHDEWDRQTREKLDATRQRKLEKQFGHIKVPRRFLGLSPATLTAEEQAGKQEAIARANLWARGDTRKPGLLIHGLPGVGKSVLGWWAVPQRGWGLWITWPEFYKAVQEGYGRGDARGKMRTAKEVPVLFLDDLGDPDRVWYDADGLRSRMATDDQRDILFELINHRLKEWLPVFVTSNLAGDGLMAQFGDRIMSRLLELCEFVEMGGSDLRRLRK